MRYALFILCLFSVSRVFAQHHTHNMILLGENKIFASHIVYKQPHNYQLLISLNLDERAKQAYLQSKYLNPKDLQIFLLDPMDLRNIDKVSRISGKLLTENSLGQRRLVLENVMVARKEYAIVFFNELPLSLENRPSIASLTFQRNENDSTCVRSPVVKCDAGETAYLCKRNSGETFVKCK